MLPTLTKGTDGADGYHGSLVLGGYDENRIVPNTTGTYVVFPHICLLADRILAAEWG
jgi:hypothetical protein